MWGWNMDRMDVYGDWGNGDQKWEIETILTHLGFRLPNLVYISITTIHV